ncbi:metallophosphoesterase [Priestia megaterium]|uniref:metallophosphoesterase n=1 Tax=Priestia megaterium TaxID=1404 RepID=UPI002731DCA0|nr:metallophosphoesterase [Priestia megaterium]MDP1442182.1 metallophosphoesterase [Priestia megaterium]MDP1471228.1 metallophosphoesterase [Priestia megaterium]
MLLSIIHLTDIHLNNSSNPLLDKTDSLWRALKSELRSSDIVVCCISGDVAQSGNGDEYFNYAIPLFDNIRDEIKKEVNLDCDFIFIPGNHDCDFSNNEANATREILIGGIGNGNGELASHTVEAIRVQKNFDDFKDLFHGSWNYCKSLFKDSLVEKVSLMVGEKNIVFNLYNSSWISTLHEKPGQMIFPVAKYEEKMKKPIGDINISLVHHPDHWLEPNNRRKFRELLEDTSDFILSGHEHQTTQGIVTDWNNKHIQYIEGGVLQENSDPSVSSYNIIHFNLNNNKQKIVEYSWTENRYKVNNDTEWQDILTDKSIKSKQDDILEVKYDFNTYLDDLNMPFIHPRSTNLRLNDIYVYPNVKEILYQNKHEELVKFQDIEDVVSGVSPQSHIVFSGDKECGKTALGKVLFNYFYLRDRYPLIIEGSDIRPGKLTSIHKIIEENAKKIYGEERSDLYLQLDKAERVLIIDNWQTTSLNHKHKSKFLSEATKWFDNVIFLTEKSSSIGEFIHLVSDVEESYTIREFEIQELGYEKREELLEKWIILGQEEVLEDEEFIRIKDKYEKSINSIVGQNYVPTYPLYILIILQTLESGTPHNFERSTNGYYYEVLIKQSLGKIQLSNEETDKMYNYLTEMAYKFFKEEISVLDEDDWRTFHEYYRQEYGLTLQQFSFEEFKQKLTESKIFDSSRSGFRFSYSYIYYYFVAQYLAKAIQEDETRNIITILCKNIYKADYAHIIMFLTHLSKDRYIIQKVIESAKAIFEDVPLLKLEDDISLINDLMDHIPQLVIGNIDVKENRKKENKRKDEINRSFKDKDTNPDEPEESQAESSIELANEINKSFKMIEILGQILKNYYGSTKASEKIELCNEVFSVALRVNNTVILTLKEDHESIIRYITTVIEENGNVKDYSQIEKAAKRILYTLATATTFTTIKKISLSVGTKNLDETFKSVHELIPYTSVKLINAAIKLEHYERYPFEEISKLYRQLKGNKVGTDLLRNMVGKYLYMFQTNYQERQQICDSVGIKYKPQVLIAATKNAKILK